MSKISEIRAKLKAHNSKPSEEKGDSKQPSDTYNKRLEQGWKISEENPELAKFNGQMMKKAFEEHPELELAHMLNEEKLPSNVEFTTDEKGHDKKSPSVKKTVSKEMAAVIRARLEHDKR